MRRVSISELAENKERFYCHEGEEIPSDLEYLEISKLDSLYLPILGCGNDDRFAKLFREVWQL